MKTIKQLIIDRIGTVVKTDPKEFIKRALEIERELNPSIGRLELEGRVMSNILELWPDSELQQLWETYSQGELQ